MVSIKVMLLVVFVSLSVILQLAHCDSDGDIKQKPKKKLPKDPLFITELDLENLYDEWEEKDDEKLPPDELPPHLRPSKPILPEGVGGDDEFFKDPEKLMRASKKGKTVMAFVTVDGKPSRQDTEELTARWQVGLTNNHMKCQRFVVDDNRAIFVFEDGSQAFEAKDYMIDQPELREFSIDNRAWHGKASLRRRDEL